MNQLLIGGYGSCGVAVKSENAQKDCVMGGAPRVVPIVDRLGE